MSADKRSVHTDALASLGTLELGESPGRDAIHLAVEPIEAAEKLYPGQDIGIVEGKATGNTFAYLGIVDPFLKKPVQPGQKFWLIVYPRTITSLRHVWEHPDFEKQIDYGVEMREKYDQKTSEQWLRDWCKNTDNAPNYEELIELINTGSTTNDPGDDNEGYGARWTLDGEYLFAHGHSAGGEIPQAYEVKHHLEIVTGKRILSFPQYFTCSC